MKLIKRITAVTVFALLSACAATPTQDSSEKTDNISVGKVQREIRIGMPNAEVVEALGSPNIVTTDENRREVWVYDRVSTDISSASGSGGVWLLFIGGSSSSSHSSKSQKTLTIVVKFDDEKRVRDFSYHTSRF